MDIFQVIAQRHGVDPNDPIQVRKFFTDEMFGDSRLSPDERDEIISEVFSEDPERWVDRDPGAHPTSGTQRRRGRR